MNRRGPPPPEMPMVDQSGPGFAPPSTIAAQIVSNAANPNAHLEPEKNAVFGLLLQEYLNDPAADESDAELYAQLISVVAEAGLDGLLQGNPFALHKQAVDSLAVIKLIIRRRPQLLRNAEAEDSNSESQPPLFIWLFPKLLALLGHPKLDQIQAELKDLLLLCVRSSFQAIDLLDQGPSIVQLYQSCVESISLALNGADGASRFMNAFKVILPPSSSISSFWSESQQFVALPQGSQRSITSKPQAIFIALSLIDVMLSSEKTDQRSSIQFYCDRYLPHALDNCSVLWKHFTEWRTSNERDDKVDNTIESAFLSIIESIFMQNSLPNNENSFSTKTAFFLARSLSDILVACRGSPFCRENQYRLACLLCQAMSPPDKSSSSSLRKRNMLLRESLQPTLVRVSQNSTWIQELSPELQVCIYLFDIAMDEPNDYSSL